MTGELIMDGLKFLALLGVAGGGVALVFRLRGGGGDQFRITPAKLTTTTTRPARDFGGIFGFGADLLGGLVSRPDQGAAPAPSAANIVFRAPASTVALAGSGSLRPLQQVIQRAESGGDYNIIFHGSKIRPARPITTMTVREVLAWQDQSVAAGSASSAVGAYQIIRRTLRDIVAAGVLSMDEIFDRAAQDRAGVHLMQRRGLDRYLSGKMSADEFGNSLAREWAGLPVLTGSKAGRSYYAGDGLNNSTVSVAQVRNALQQIGSA